MKIGKFNFYLGSMDMEYEYRVWLEGIWKIKFA